jgi:hypothetical protein
MSSPDVLSKLGVSTSTMRGERFGRQTTTCSIFDAEERNPWLTDKTSLSAAKLINCRSDLAADESKR